MPNDVIDSILTHDKFKAVMSRDARRLRDEVLNACFKRNHVNCFDNKFINLIVLGYDPIVWEIPILYSYHDVVLDSFLRVTSKVYKEQLDAGREARGDKGKSRRKDIDWVEVATKFPQEWWIPLVDKTRATSIHPTSFEKTRPQFTDMYRLFSDWLLVDFSASALFRIYDVSRRYSTVVVSECMDMIDDPHNRSIEYITAVVEREVAAREAAMLENKELLKSSKEVLKFIVGVANEHRSAVNWSEVENKFMESLENKDEFDKVKLS